MTNKIKQAIRAWALCGGILLIGVVLVNAISILSSILFNKPFSGDFELTEMGVGIAAFCFLPYCQLVGANISADIFTSKMSPLHQRCLEMVGHVIAVLFALLLIWRMSIGLGDYIEYAEITGVLSIPIWYAFVPALISLVLLLIAAILSVTETWTKI